MGYGHGARGRTWRFRISSRGSWRWGCPSGTPALTKTEAVGWTAAATRTEPTASTETAGWTEAATRTEPTTGAETAGWTGAGHKPRYATPPRESARAWSNHVAVWTANRPEVRQAEGPPRDRY